MKPIPPIFSDPWATACASLINASEAYRAAAQHWEGAVLLVMSLPGGTEADRRVFLDLWHGECRQARVARVEDDETARYIMAGEGEAWRQVLNGRIPPMLAFMTGKLKLTKGTLLELLPYVHAAKGLVAAAAAVEADWAGA